MARLTSSNYLQTRTWLTELWATDPTIFGLLSAGDQRYLHDYYRPSEALGRSEALVHRVKVSTRQRSLPQCAGRAVRHLTHALQTPVPVGPPGARKQVVVSPVIRPQVDVDDLVRALLRAARDGSGSE